MSKQPLTGLCFDIAISPVEVQSDKVPDNPFPKDDTKTVFSAIKIKLVHSKDNSSVLYAEVEADFVDILFGLLCVPLGSVIKTYGQWSSDGSIDNLYRSIGGSARTCMKPQSPSLLLTPKLAPFFGCSRNVLQTEEMIPRSVHFSCFKCHLLAGAKRCGCSCPYTRTVTEMNPKSPSTGSDNTAKAYVKGGLRTFLVTNDLRVLHFTLTNTLQVMRAAKIPKEKLVEKELALDKAQVDPTKC
uniref:Uncharacterized protein n=1 Tax=Avena sativa TaxID=4498 RepID=A0ACD5V532_AVESA